MSGYGDYLMLTAVIHNIKRVDPDTSVIVTNITSKPNKTRNHFSHIFEHNRQVDQYLSVNRIRFLWERFKNRNRNVSYVSSRLKKTSPYGKMDEDRVIYPHDKHAIEIFCKPYRISNPELRPRIFLSTQESTKVDTILQQHGLEPGQFIILEPGTEHKTASKRWPTEYWERLSSALNHRYPKIKLVMISPYTIDLPHVIQINGGTSFRQAMRYIEQAACLVTTEGGLMHLAAAIPKSCVIIYSGYLPRTLMSYPLHKNLYPDSSIPCLECGQRLSCDNDLVCMSSITPEQVLEAVSAQINQQKDTKSPQ